MYKYGELGVKGFLGECIMGMCHQKRTNFYLTGPADRFLNCA